MSKRTKEHLAKAADLLAQSRSEAQAGSLAYQLQTSSLQSHMDELQTYDSLESLGRTYELIDFRMQADTYRAGSIPLEIVAKAAEELRKMVGYAALRLVEGGMKRKRVPEYLYDDLDLRLAGLLPGSSRLLIAAAAHRDLFDDGIAKLALQRVFDLLTSEGRGETFLQAVTDLGSSSVKSLRDFLRVIRATSGALEVTWTHGGQSIGHWSGDREHVAALTSALEMTDILPKEDETIRGVIELLSKRERIHVRTDYGKLVRVLFPKRLLAQVSELHLDQRVVLDCQVVQTVNPLTNESSEHHELLKIQN